jgi:hypothetical protein
MRLSSSTTSRPPKDHAEAALEALLRSSPSPEITQQLERLTSENPLLARAFAMHRSATS